MYNYLQPPHTHYGNVSCGNIKDGAQNESGFAPKLTII